MREVDFTVNRCWSSDSGGGAPKVTTCADHSGDRYSAARRRRRRRRESLDIPSLPLLVVMFASLTTRARGRRARHPRAGGCFHNGLLATNAFVPIPAPPTTAMNRRLREMGPRGLSRTSQVAAGCPARRAAPPLRIGHAGVSIVGSSSIPSPRRRSHSTSPAGSRSLSTSSTCLALSPSVTQFFPLVKPADDWGNVAILSAAASAAHVLGNRTSVGRLLGPPVSAMAIAFLMGSIGILPPGGSAGCKMLQSLSLQLATPLLLLGADLRGCGERAGPLLVAFVLASTGTVLASCLAAMLFGPSLSRAMPNPGDGIKIAAALMAKNVGGGINYVAVCRSLGASPVAVAAGLCVDNIFALVYFPATSALASGLPDVGEDVADGDVVGDDATSSSSPSPPLETTAGGAATSTPTPALSVGDVSTALSLSLLATWIGERVGGPHSAALPTSTLFTVLLASLAPDKWLRPLRPAGEVLGTALLYLFFATAGAPGMAVADSVKRAFVPLGGYLCVLYGIHGAFLYASRRLFLRFGLSPKAVAPQRLLAASSAAIGGPATAAALAQANGWASLLAPSLLVGNLGYAVATFAGLAFHALFRASS